MVETWMDRKGWKEIERERRLPKGLYMGDAMCGKEK